MLCDQFVRLFIHLYDTRRKIRLLNSVLAGVVTSFNVNLSNIKNTILIIYKWASQVCVHWLHSFFFFVGQNNRDQVSH